MSDICHQVKVWNDAGELVSTQVFIRAGQAWSHVEDEMFRGYRVTVTTAPALEMSIVKGSKAATGRGLTSHEKSSRLGSERGTHHEHLSGV